MSKNSIYFKQEVPPTRDERLEIGDSFNGCSCDLVHCTNTGCLAARDRAFWQSSSSCQMGLACTMSSTMENTVVIMHGPVGCGHQLHSATVVSNAGKAARGLPVKPLNWLSTNLTETEIVTGGEQKLLETILYADRTFRPELIFVLSTCAPNVIGDDVDSVVNEAREIVSAQVTAIHCPGFRSRMVSSAYDSYYHSLLRNIQFEPIPWKDYVPFNPADPTSAIAEANYKYQKEHTVNLMSLESVGAKDEAELSRLITALGLFPRVYAEYSNADKLRWISEAALNVSMCQLHDDYILSYLEETYNIPSYTGMPMGLKATRRWLTEIGKHFGLEKEANALADQEEKLVLEALEPYREKLKGKRVLLHGGSVRAAVQAPVLRDLGMEVTALSGYLVDSNAVPVFEELDSEMPKVPVAISEQPFEFVNQVRHYKPDILLVHNGYMQIAGKYGIPAVQMFDSGSTYFGYSGLFQMAKDIAFALENSAYIKRVAKYVKLPYKEEWYEKNPFSYQKD